MASSQKPSLLLTEEDWWTVWFGAAIIVIATVLALFTITGRLPALRAPALGTWSSNPADLFYRAKKAQVHLKGPTTAQSLVDTINARNIGATARLDPDPGGVRLRITSARNRPEETISVEALVEGGETKLSFTKVEADPDGLGARGYLSGVLPSGETLLGKGRLSIKSERWEPLFLPLVITPFLLLLLTALGIRVMGGSVRRYAPAFLVVFVLAIFAFALDNQKVSHAYGLSYAAWGLALGLIISNTIGTPSWLMPGVKTEMYIKTGLVLLGAEILFGKILKLGVPGLMVAWIVTPVVIFFMWLFGTRILRMASKPLVMIIAAATSVCGVSAAIAVAAATRAKKDELTLAVGMTLIFTVIMMIFMPVLIHAVGMNPVLGGAWMGGTIDSTGAVVAAGAFLGPNAETVAAVVKMIQNILIGVVGFAVALFWITSVERDPSAPRPGLSQIWVRFPKFIVGFVGASILFSFLLPPLFAYVGGGEGLSLVESNVLKPITTPLRSWFFCLAFVSIGLESNFKDLARQMEGGKPMLLYVVGQSFNLLLTLAVAWLAFMVLFKGVV